MSSIKQLKKDLQEESVPLSVILRRAREVAEKLGQEEFVLWIDKELNGYGKGQKVPEYRVVHGEVKGWNPYRGWVPVLFQSTEVEQSISQRGASQSIPEFEELLKDSSSTFEMSYPADIANRILAQESLKTKVSLMIPRTAITSILNQVRNKVYEWVLKLDESGIPDEKEEYSDIQKREASTAQQTIHIENINSMEAAEQPRDFTGQFVQPQESFLTRFFWFGIVAFLVLVAGNIASALVLKYFFHI